jgi:hypothetical protein
MNDQNAEDQPKNAPTSLETPAKGNPEPTADAPKPTRSLVRKLCEIMDAVGYVQKTGINRFHGYKYATEADLVEMIRGEFAKRQVFVFPDVVEYTRVPLEVESSKGIRKTQISEVNIAWTFVDGESGEERTVHVRGVGEDNVDKGFYKAFTGSEKYLLMKSFLIPTGDDPEDDDAQAIEKGKKNVKDVAERRLKEAAKEYESIELVEVGDRLVIRGNGLSIVRASMSEEEKKKFTFKMDSFAKAWTIRLSEGNQFESVCQRLNVPVKWIDPGIAAESAD